MSDTRKLEETAELLNKFANTFFAPFHADWPMRIAGATHQGLVREKNEDRYIALRRVRSRDVLATNLEPQSLNLRSDQAYVMVVADGVGGAAHGEFASQLALETAVELGTNATSWVMKFGSMDAQQVRARTDAYIGVIQETLLAYAESTPELRGMGTTWTSAYIVPPHAVVIHIGDSRAYQYSRGNLRQVTRDQTLAQQLIDAGSPPESVSKLRSVLTNCLGGKADDVTAEIYKLTLEHGDRLLLCTDGLSDLVEDAKIAQVMADHADPQTVCDQLIQLALDNGGKDNVTVVLCSVGSEDESSSS
jgi:protein phosphatase